MSKEKNEEHERHHLGYYLGPFIIAIIIAFSAHTLFTVASPNKKPTYKAYKLKVISTRVSNEKVLGRGALSNNTPVLNIITKNNIYRGILTKGFNYSGPLYLREKNQVFGPKSIRKEVCTSPSTKSDCINLFK